MSDLITSLQAALSKSNSEGYTVRELAAQAGLEVTERNQNKIRAFLKSEIAAGRIVGKVGRRMNISGILAACPVFVPVEKKK